MASPNQPTTVSISMASIAKVVLVVLLIAFLYLIRDVLAILFVSLVLASAFDPWVDAFQRRGLPRAVGILSIYVLIFGIVGLSVYLLIPPISEQVRQLTQNFPQLYQKISREFESLRGSASFDSLTGGLQQGLQTVQSSLSRAAGSIFTTLSGIFGGLFTLFAVIVITFYTVIEENGLKRFLRSFTPGRFQPYINQLVNKIQEHMGMWLRGQLLLLLIIGVLSYFALLIIGVQYPLPLALWAGLTEFIPYIGPIIGGIPAAFIAFSQSPLQGFVTIGAFIVIQNLENHLIVPRVMSKAVGLNPILVIVVLLVGAKVAGIAGVILAIPFTLIVSAVLTTIFNQREKTETRLEG